MNKPLYTFQINSISACFEIKINDIPLYNERKGKPTSAEIPVNHLLINSLNKIKVTISPSKYDALFQDHSKTDFELFVREIDGLRSDRESIIKLNFPDYIHDDTLKSSTIPSEATFQSNLPILTKWFNCPVMNLNEKNLDEIFRVYRMYFQFLKEKNIEAILNLTMIKDNDFASSYFMSMDQQQSNIRDSFTEVFTTPEYELIDFDIQQKSPMLHGFGKLVTLINSDNRSPLQFFNSRTSVTKSYPIYLGFLDSTLKILV